ncbi:hypothetical protein HBN50_10765 [Halobacteriovorax sp. GB3]|uniref:hypothetical protein n=1 Tax=Halobacteriovorax sp. GB3 TaxID=2719615 RepID=UPI0023613952|nr:hypothetical protein [Halobacteriovorax sp. GB3]MDD0853584.1 hypothetical protein [Halobacteriovorax sp. GB3]
MKTLVALSLTLFSHAVFAASCCGGGSSFPGLITTDSKGQISLSSTYLNEVGKAKLRDEYVYYNEDKKRKSLQSLLSSSYMTSEFTQLSLNLSYVQREYEQGEYSEKSHQLGDSELSFAYEFFPEKEYSWWKPRGFVFLSLTLPTGKTNYQSSELLYSDVSGKAQWALAVGGAFTKVNGPFDFQGSFKAAHRFKESFSNVTVEGSQFFSTLLSAGFSPSKSSFRFGASHIYFFETKRKVNNGQKVSQTLNEYYHELALSSHYMLNDELSAGIIYADQTLIGPVQNTSLSRKLTVQILKRWSL